MSGVLVGGVSIAIFLWYDYKLKFYTIIPIKRMSILEDHKM
jgi:hypothetical protein